MKKIFLLATAALLISGVSFADNGKKKSKGAKGKSCSATCEKPHKKEKDKVKETSTKL